MDRRFTGTRDSSDKKRHDTPIWAVCSPGWSPPSKRRGAPRRPHRCHRPDNAEAAERIPGSLAGSTLTQLTIERRSLRLLSIDGVAPSLEALESGPIRSARRFIFVLPRRQIPRGRFRCFPSLSRRPAILATAATSSSLIRAIMKTSLKGSSPYRRHRLQLSPQSRFRQPISLPAMPTCLTVSVSRLSSTRAISQNTSAVIQAFGSFKMSGSPNCLARRCRRFEFQKARRGFVKPNRARRG